MNSYSGSFGLGMIGKRKSIPVGFRRHGRWISSSTIQTSRGRNSSSFCRAPLIRRLAVPSTTTSPCIPRCCYYSQKQGRGVDVDAWNDIQEERHYEALELLSRPPGTFQPKDIEAAREILERFQQTRSFDSETIRLNIRLLERVVNEYFSYRGNVIFEWMRPSWCDKMLSLWKEASLKKKFSMKKLRQYNGDLPPEHDQKHSDIISPVEVFRIMQSLSTKVPRMGSSVVAMSSVLDVAIKLADPPKAPYIAKQFVDYMEQEAKRKKTKAIRPNLIIYTQLIQAWAFSGLPQSAQEIEATWTKMKENGITPGVVACNILIRFWGRLENAEKLDETMKYMAKEKIEPNKITYNSAIYGYAVSGQLQRAENMLDALFQEDFENEKDYHLLSSGAQIILGAYRKIIDSDKISREEKEKTLEKAGFVYKELKLFPDYKKYNKENKPVTTLMDLYARMGKYEQLEHMAKRMRFETAQWAVLIKAYGKADLPVRSTNRKIHGL